MARDSLIDLEKHRLLLEDNINQLRTALQHWQTWDAEYETLKEEVEAASDPSPAELETIREGYEGELVTKKEIGEIFGLGNLRSQDQIINLLDRRIDYVTKSIESLQKQLETAENKYAVASVISQPDAQDEEGQPMTEIIEELDDDDNVISYRLNQPGESMSHIREALNKAGIKDLPELDNDTGNGPSKAAKELSTASREVEAATAPTRAEPVPKKSPKKNVSFADDTEPIDEAEPSARRPMVRRVQNIMETAKDQDKIIHQPVIPEDEDAEDAALRAEMLKYSMGEVGAVVAELQLEEGYTDEEDYEFEYTDEEEEEEDDDDDDKYGRYTGRIVTDDYKQRMLELEEKLGVKSRFTVKEEAKAAAAAAEAGDNSDADDTCIGRIKVNHDATSSSSATQLDPPKSIIKEKQPNGASGKKKKGVSFADSLDIAPEEETIAPILKERQPVEPLSDVIVERSPATKQNEAKSARKPSRFKKSRDETPQDISKGPMDIIASFLDQDRPIAPTGPNGKTLADALVERETVPRPMPAEDEFDDFMIQSEVADEHQRLRRKFITREGGFLKENESAIMPLDEPEDGREKPSRFKAARLSRQ